MKFSWQPFTVFVLSGFALVAALSIGNAPKTTSADNTDSPNGSRTDFGAIVFALKTLNKNAGATNGATSHLSSPPTTLVDIPDPDGYQLVFGPIGGANSAPGYMGFSFIDEYDVDACAQLCNTRGADQNGGACQYFNIWEAIVNGVPTTYTCAFYYLPTNASTADVFGQGDLTVSNSRGYKRFSLIQGGDFETFQGCPPTTMCLISGNRFWVSGSPQGGFLDAGIIQNPGFTRSGIMAGCLGSYIGHDGLAGVLEPSYTINTVAGRTYSLTFFHRAEQAPFLPFLPPASPNDVFVDIMWNRMTIETIRPGFSSHWTYYEFKVVATGQDHLAFHGGKAPALSYIDDVFLFLA